MIIHILMYRKTDVVFASIIPYHVLAYKKDLTCHGRIPDIDLARDCKGFYGTGICPVDW